jgi:hypothetical protein
MSEINLDSLSSYLLAGGCLIIRPGIIRGENGKSNARVFHSVVTVVKGESYKPLIINTAIQKNPEEDSVKSDSGEELLRHLQEINRSLSWEMANSYRLEIQKTLISAHQMTKAEKGSVLPFEEA